MKKRLLSVLLLAGLILSLLSPVSAAAGITEGSSAAPDQTEAVAAVTADDAADTDEAESPEAEASDAVSDEAAVAAASETPAAEAGSAAPSSSDGAADAPSEPAPSAKDVWIDNTVDNSKTTVIGVVTVTDTATGEKTTKQVYFEEIPTTFSSYSSPPSEAIANKIAAAEQAARAAVGEAGYTVTKCETAETQNTVFDNRKYETIEDGDAVLIGDVTLIGGDPNTGDITRTHIASGDYGRLVTYTVTLEATYSAPTAGGGDKYTVTANVTGSGSVALDPAEPAPGERVTVSMQADSGWVLSDFYVGDSGGQISAGIYGNSGTTQDSISFTMPSDNVTVSVGFVQVVNCTVTFVSNGGTGVMEAASVPAETDYTLPACGFAKTDRTFFKWSVAGTEYDAYAPIHVSANTEVTAVWRYNDTVVNDNAVDRSTTEVVGVLVLKDTRTDSTVTATVTDEVTASLFTEPSNPTVNAMIGEAKEALLSEAQTLAGGAALTVTAETVSDPSISRTVDNRTYTYYDGLRDDAGDCYSLRVSEGDYCHFWTYTVTLSAEYASPEPQYAVTVSTDGNGTAAAKPAAGIPGTVVTLSAEPVTGFRFKEWKVLEGGVTVGEDSTFTLGSADVSVQAVFEPIPCGLAVSTTAGGSYTANGETHEGGLNMTLSWGDMVSLVAVPEAGHRFVGWYVGVIGDSAFVEGHTDDMIWPEPALTFSAQGFHLLCAVFEEIPTHTVRFDAGGGMGEMKPETVFEGDSFTLPANGFTAPEKKQFRCWSVGGEEKAPGTAITVGADVTATAVWEDLRYIVSFNTDGGSAVQAQTVTVGGTAAKPADPTRTGHAFAGWFAGADAAYDFSTPVNADITLTAHWTALPAEYPIVSGANGGWTRNSGMNYVLIVKRSYEDETCIDHFVGVAADGVLLTRGSDYDAAPGSTVITLKAAFLQKLAIGAHTLSIFFDDASSTPTTRLTVQDAPSTTKAPKTGDSADLALWAVLLGASALGAASIALPAARRRRRAN